MEDNLAELQTTLQSLQTNFPGLARYKVWINSFQTKLQLLGSHLEDKIKLEMNYAKLNKENLKYQEKLDDLSTKLERERSLSSLMEKTNHELTEALSYMRRQVEGNSTQSSIRGTSEAAFDHRASSMDLEAQLKDLSFGSVPMTCEKAIQTMKEEGTDLVENDLLAMLACSASAVELSLQDQKEAYEAFTTGL
jgi:predicted  nucleic acid-binding Zn-ribbon protein